ncbi:hypothetical protein [Microbacterium tumbae]
MSGTRAIPEEELPFPPERIEHADAEEQPETQGEEPELGEGGQGDLAAEDEPDASTGDAEPRDLRDEAP